ncbi:hypothetical protein ACFC1T_02345 [Kitasatospora sp. NPDC056076]|uniref:hypothetical protein n=1 Tax=Kitasatospora sp. NPDC056076 TaxID=3345703 RepID=UPI0035E04481
MSVGGAGIPRLQELTYIESAALAVAAREPFEQIRLAILRQAEMIALNGDHDGLFDQKKWNQRRANSMAYVHNTVDVLKELMRLGWVERHVLPSTPRSAYAHAHVTYEPTAAGRAWADLIRQDRPAGYNALTGALLTAHPQFEGYLRLVGARPDSASDHLTIPLLRNDGPPAGDHNHYLDAFVSHVTEAVLAGGLGWTTSSEAVEEGLRGYVNRAVLRSQARASQGGTAPAPPITRKRFAILCEEAAVRLAFTAAGCSMDYISHELLRRWTRFLGLANFSYYAPGPQALRLWATGLVEGSGEAPGFDRNVGEQVRLAALRALPRIWSSTNGLLDDASYHPVWRIRAAVCWDLRISDEEFDAAIEAAYRGNFSELGFRVHLDEASNLRTPGSVRPLVLGQGTGRERVFHVMSLVGARQTEEVLAG